MPKTYQAPEPKQGDDRESKARKTVGVYEKPVRTGPSREIIIAIAVIVAIVVIFVLYRLARGEESQQPTAWTISGVAARSEIRPCGCYPSSIPTSPRNN